MLVLPVGLWMLALTVHDVRDRRLPNALTLPGSAAVLAWAAVTGRGPAAAAGALALAGGYLAVHLVMRAAMGAGDVKLAIGLGALTGAFGIAPWALAAIGAPLLTAVAGVLTRRRVLPHGPSMCAASALALLPLLLTP